MKHSVLSNLKVSESVTIVRMERTELAFQPGQYVSVGQINSRERRDYTLYSSPLDDYIELLIKTVAGGDVSGKLTACREGEELDLEGPFGFFTIPFQQLAGKFLFVATGTGISPFHSYIKSYLNLDYKILHGVGTPKELYGYESFQQDRHVGCLTKSDEGHFQGRVTDYLRQHPINPQSNCYLCGNSEMIFEAFKILQDQGVPREHCFAEVYF